MQPKGSHGASIDDEEERLCVAKVCKSARWSVIIANGCDAATEWMWIREGEEMEIKCS